MKTEAEYTYLLIDEDLDRIQRLIGMLGDAVTDLFQVRRLAPVEELDTDLNLNEMCYHQLSCQMTENSSGPRDRRP